MADLAERYVKQFSHGLDWEQPALIQQLLRLYLGTTAVSGKRPQVLVIHVRNCVHMHVVLEILVLQTSLTICFFTDLSRILQNLYLVAT